MGLANTLRFIAHHPLTREHRAVAVLRFLTWQAGSRLSPGPVAVPFVNDARLLVKRGMTGATGNVYTGLHEFEDMAFVLHMLRPGELFADVGANVGSYTVLAGKAAGARCISVEPVTDTYRALLDNINLNGLQSQVKAVQAAVGRQAGTARMTRHLDAGNHVAQAGDGAESTEEVAVTTLDSLLEGQAPVVLKIDVEGFESEVLAGGPRTLADPGLSAILMETNACAQHYGKDERDNHRRLLELGFHAYAYAPRTRQLRSLAGDYNATANTIYLRDPEHVQARLQSAAAFHVLGQRI